MYLDPAPTEALPQTGGIARRTASTAPLTQEEKHTLIDILGVCGDAELEPRQRAALDAYIEVLSTPPLIPNEVIRSARALIRVWVDVKNMKAKKQPKKAVFATLLSVD